MWMDIFVDRNYILDIPEFARIGAAGEATILHYPSSNFWRTAVEERGGTSL